MSGFTDSMFVHTKALIGRSTALLLSAYPEKDAWYYQGCFLLPAFLFLSFIGIRKRSISAVLISSLLTPIFLDQLASILGHLKTASSSPVLTGLLATGLDGLRALRQNMPAAMAGAAVLSALLGLVTAASGGLFCTFLFFLYCTAVFYPRPTDVPVSPGALLAVALTVPVIFLLVVSATFSNFASALLFSFFGGWGLLHLLLSDRMAASEVPNAILDDLFSLDISTFRESTIFFLMAMAISIFSQYAVTAMTSAKPVSRKAETEPAGKVPVRHSHGHSHRH